MRPVGCGSTQRASCHQRLLEDARGGRIDIILAEPLDRLSRNQETVAALHKQLGFACPAHHTWPARVAALMAADLSAALSTEAQVTVGTGAMQQILESHVRAHLAELAEPAIGL